MIALQYHEASKHYFNRFARSTGYLDWATQPDPFRRFHGAPRLGLSHEPLASDVSYEALYLRSAPVIRVDAHAIGEFLRCSMGLSAWKAYQSSRWPLRVNPSSGNLHPTETYVVHRGGVFHYLPREHALEQRATLDANTWQTFSRGQDGFLVALSSIHWREAWKYGERAFRYCQHDTGHAIGALALSASRLGWTMRLLPQASDVQVATMLGLDRDDDFTDAEREEPECIAVVTPAEPEPWLDRDPAALVDAARGAPWQGRANRLSSGHVDWPIIDRVARATRYPGVPTVSSVPLPVRESHLSPQRGLVSCTAREVMLRRRSALAFDPRPTLSVDRFLPMLERLRPHSPPWDAIDWPPQVHLVVFVHRIDGLTPGVYAYLRDESVREEWRAAMRPDLLWERVHDLYLLLPTDVSWAANRISCDQDIAGDGFFSLGMIARLAPALSERGEWFYRRLYWECGLIGQILYLEAEAADARATGIGCFYDDAVHELLGLSGNTWQSLYHFSMGIPVEDPRLTTEPGYRWEDGGSRNH